MTKKIIENGVTETAGSAASPAQAKANIFARLRARRRARRRGPRLYDRPNTTLYIDDAGIKLLVTRGRYVTAWAEAPLDPGLVSGGLVTDIPAVAVKVRALLDEKHIKAKKITVGLSGLHCLSRIITLPRLNWSVLNEAVKREAERELPVTLENLYLAWQIVGASKDKLRIFLIAYARNSADAMVETVRRAGLKPAVMDLAPLAITRVANKRTAVIMDVGSKELDITVMVDGIPELVRSLPLGEGTVRSQLPLIQDELERTLKFFNSMNWEDPLNKVVVFVSGQVADEPELYETLSERLGVAVVPPSPLLLYRGLPRQAFMVNIGLAMKKFSAGKAGPVARVNLNVLPEVYRPHYPSAGKVLPAAGAALAIAAVVWVAILSQTAAARTEEMRADLVAHNAALAQRQAEQRILKDSIAALEKQFAAETQTNDTFAASVSSIRTEQQAVNSDIALVSGAADGVSLTVVRHLAGVFSVSGTASSEGMVFAYADRLMASGKYPEIVITNLSKKSASFDFTLTLRR